MTIIEMHYQFKLAKDAVDALSRHTFSPAQIDWLLNDAQIRIVRAKTSGENEKLLGYEQTQKLTDEFSILHIKYPLQSDVPITNHNDGVYEISLADLLFPYLRLLNAKVTDKECKKFYNLKFVQSDDMNIALRDPFNDGSSEFIPYNIGRSSVGTSSSLYLYTDLNIELGRIEYLKYPSKMSIGTYTYIDGINYPEASCELPEEMHHKIVDKAVELAAVYITDPNSTVLKQLAYGFDS